MGAFVFVPLDSNSKQLHCRTPVTAAGNQRDAICASGCMIFKPAMHPIVAHFTIRNLFSTAVADCVAIFVTNVPDKGKNLRSP